MSEAVAGRAEVLCFDVFGTLVDPLGIQRRLEEYVGASASRLTETWRQKQLEYTFRLTAMEWHRDFEWVTRRSLLYALQATGHELRPDQVEAVMAAYAELDAFPDAAPGADELAAAGHRLTVLSNGTPQMIEAALRSARLAGRFDPVISVDEVRAFKPSPRVYERAADRLEMPLGQLMLVSSNPFDVIGARHVGMQAAWVRRAAAVFDDFELEPTLVVGSLTELATRL